MGDLNVWDALEELMETRNPRLFALIDKADAVEILKARDDLNALRDQMLAYRDDDRSSS